MKRLVLIAGIAAASPDAPLYGGDPTDPSDNSLLDVVAVNIVPSLAPGETAVEVIFDKDVTLPASCVIHSVGARKVPITTTGWTSPLLEDLDHDGHLDLVVSDTEQILVYRNLATNGDLRFRDRGELIATRQPVGTPPVLSTSSVISFADIDNDGAADLICNESQGGYVYYFRRVDAPSTPGVLAAFEPQRALRYAAAGGDVEISNSGGAMPAFVRYDDDEHLDLFIVTGEIEFVPPGPPQTQHRFWVYRYKGVDPGDGVSPLYHEPIAFEINGAQPVVGEVYSQPVPTFVEYDAVPGLDLVLSAGSGSLYVAPNTGVTSGEGYLQFAPFEAVSQGGAPVDLGPQTAAVPLDADADGDLDLLVSTLPETGVARSLIHLYRNDGAGSLPTIDGNRSVLGTRGGPLDSGRFASPGEPLPHLFVADLNGDNYPDLVRGSDRGHISVAFSADTGNHFDPLFADFVPLRDTAGTVFSTAPQAPGETPLPLPYDHDQDGATDGFLIALDISLYYSELVAGSGGDCPRLGPLQPVAFPVGFSTTGAHSICPAVGDFTPDDPTPSLDGMVLAVDDRISATSPAQRIYFVTLEHTGGLPVLTSPVLLVEQHNADGVEKITRPFLWDLDGDGNLDLITCPDEIFSWRKNAAQPGPIGVGDLSAPIAIVDQNGDPVAKPGGQFGLFESFLIFDHFEPAESAPIVIAPAEISPSGGSPVAVDIFRLDPAGPADSTLEIIPYRSKERLELIQTLPSVASQADRVLSPGAVITGSSPDSVIISVPIELLVGDEVKVNWIGVGGSPVAFDTLTVGGVDSDGDRLTDAWELANGLDPYDGDQNRNGVGDGGEFSLGLDLDADGVTNADEAAANTDALSADNTKVGLSVTVIDN